MRPVTSANLCLTKATAESLYLFNRFYKQNGHKGKAQPAHQTWGLSLEGTLIAAVRLEPFPWGNLLRGLWVHKQHRGQGLGADLLNRLTPELASSPCFCLPYNQRSGFYRRNGFEKAQQGVPLPLLQQWQRYLARGEDLTVMQYIAESARHATERPASQSKQQPLRYSHGK